MRNINLTVLILSLMAILTFGAAGTNVIPTASVTADTAALAGLAR